MNDHQDPSCALLAETALLAARSAGAVLLEEWSSDRRVHFKGDIDLVTDTDRRCEETIVSLLRSRFPDHQILAEEGSTGGSSATYRWIIDPLDGTTNYAHGYPHFAVSVALERNGKLLLGTVYNPMLDEMFTAQAGRGAYLNGRPIKVSSVGQLLRALMGTGFPYDRRLFDTALSHWQHFVRLAQGVRRDGSAALNLCYVAAGRFDAFWEDHLCPWDAAAGTLIVREAGGRVTDYEGRAIEVSEGSLIASNGLLHPEVLAGLAPSRDKLTEDQELSKTPN